MTNAPPGVVADAESTGGRSLVLAGRRWDLPMVPDAVAVHFEEPARHSVRRRVAYELGLGASVESRIEIPAERYTVYAVPATPGLPVAGLRPLMAAAADKEEVGRVTPLYHLGRTTVVATDRLVVKSSDDSAGERLESAGLVVEDLVLGYLVVSLPPTLDPLQLAARLTAASWVDSAEPDLVVLGTRLRSGSTLQALSAPGPPGLGYAGQLISADESWPPLPGRAVIAVLDDGVDAAHPDLAGVVRASFDALGEKATGQPQPWDFHGTACAGLAAAQGRPGGVRGVAASSPLLAVRVAATDRPNGHWASSFSRAASGIEWATDHGADVLSLSWGDSVPSSVVVAALRHALTAGRSGRGSVVVAAAGNTPGPVDFPGSFPGVLTVSGTNLDDEFKSPLSSDGESWWGSASGPEVDLAAPAVGLRTTDLVGPNGKTAGDYTAFNGTSAATPLVAAAAALTLSADPMLSGSSVVRILTDTADRVGSRAYVEGRNDELGFGRLNVRRAVTAALDRHPRSPARPPDRPPLVTDPEPPSEERFQIHMGAPPGRGDSTGGSASAEPGPNEVLLGTSPGAAPAPPRPRRAEPGPGQILLG